MGKAKRELFRIEGMSKVFADRYVFNDVSFSIYEGEIFGLIGGSGSGKTTFLNLLVGFLKPDKGKILFQNIHLLDSDKAEAFISIYKRRDQLKPMYGFATQNPGFYSNLTVKENLLYFASLYNISNDSAKANAESILELVDLTQAQHKLAKQLSGGMQRRLDIACALIHDPKILILDEPTSDLDPVLSNKIWNLIRVINQQGTTVIIASHDLEELENICDRVAIIKEGKLAAIGKPSELKAKTVSQKIFLKLAPGNYKTISSELKKLGKNITQKIIATQITTDGFYIHTKNPEEIMPSLLEIIKAQNEKLLNVEFIKPNLSHVFAEITKGNTTVSEEKKEHKKKHHNHKKRHRK